MKISKNDIYNAFPGCLKRDVGFICDTLVFDTALASSDVFVVKCRNEVLHIPERIYYKPIADEKLSCLAPIQSEIVKCFFTRHHDGLIREDCLRHVIGLNSYWVAPFIIKLSGEYVVEILNIIKANLDNLDSAVYKEFLLGNTGFYEVIKQRVMSYWNVYYKRQYPDKNEFAGFQILNYFDELMCSK